MTSQSPGLLIKGLLQGPVFLFKGSLTCLGLLEALVLTFFPFPLDLLQSLFQNFRSFLLLTQQGREPGRFLDQLGIGLGGFILSLFLGVPAKRGGLLEGFHPGPQNVLLFLGFGRCP